MTIIDEAIKDAQLLQEAATKLAEKRLISALSPRIKQMVESRLFEEEELDFDQLLTDLEGEDDADEEEYDAGEEEYDAEGADFEDDVQMSMSMSPDDGIQVTDDTTSQHSYVNVHADGDVNIELEMDEEEEEDEPVLTGGAVIEAKAAIKRIAQNAAVLRNRAKRARNLSESKKIYRNAGKLKESVLNYADEPILTGNAATNAALQEAFTTLTSIQKETEKAMRRYTRFNEGKRRKTEMAYEGDYANEMEELDELDAVLSLTPDDEDEAEMLTGLDLDDLDIAVDVSDEEGDEEDDGGLHQSGEVADAGGEVTVVALGGALEG
jgi:hypothetical protein